MAKAQRTLAARKDDALIPFATLDFSMPQARRALEAFAQNRFAAWESVAQSAREAIARSIEQLLSMEMTIFLGDADQAGNKRNGFHNVRDYHVKGLGRLELRLPRDRNRSFESVVTPRYERMDPRLREDLALLHLAGISTRTMAMISRHLLGLDVSNKTVASSMAVLRPAAEQWLKRPLDRRFWALYVDGTKFKVQRRGSTEAEPMLCVLGVDDTQHRSVLAVEPGWRESVDAWRAAFRELKPRPRRCGGYGGRHGRSPWA